MEQDAVSLVAASATKMLGKYDHSFEFDGNVVILFGPNGVGKTKFLEAIGATMALDGYTLLSIPFCQIEIAYSDGSVLRSKSAEKTADSANAEHAPGSTITFEIQSPDGERERWEYVDDGFREWAGERFGGDRSAASTFSTGSGRDEISAAELREIYARRAGRRRREGNSVPDSFKRLKPDAEAFLIETQRLNSEIQPPSAIDMDRRNGKFSRRQVPKIVRQAEVLKLKINEAETEHSKVTQKLDRTFPTRVLARSLSGELPDSNEIRKRFAEQNEFRSRVGRIVDVSLDAELQLPGEDFPDWALSLLDLYLSDAEEKLEPFSGIVEKIELLESIINARLLDKELSVTAGEGFEIRVDGHDNSVSLDALSSGEQHEIILMFDLLFNVPAGATVLIDEPEISLHIAWQIEFIPDVKRIADVGKFNFVVATHSPQIINNAWDRAVRLGPSEARFE